MTSTTTQPYVLVRAPIAERKGPASLEPVAPATRLAVRMRGRATSRRTARKPRRSAGKPQREPSLPPALDLVSVVPAVRRFQANVGVSATPITRASFASICGGIVTVANTTVTMWASSFRLVKIVVWPAAGQGVLFDIPAGGTAEQALQRETMHNEQMPAGTTLDHPVVFRPSKKGFLSMWQQNGVNNTDQLFLLSCATGTVIDVHFVYTQASGVGVGVAVTTPTSSVVALQTIAYMPLDTGNKLPNVGLFSALH